MEHAPPTSPLAPVHPDGGYYLPKVSEMNVHESMTDDSSLALWDLDLLDFTVDDHFSLSLQPEESPTISPQLEIPVETSSSDRIRKRDPRLTCSNFIAGRVPCACPELDRKLEEEARGPGKKRPRTARSTHGKAICQVPGCEADIRELKGYHRRHRVCLRCANATAVLVDGDTKRYCQQCGKFHVLSDFDEGKRSCRRKLERHNNRRRRKPNGSVVVVENESQASIQDEDFVSDPDPGKDYSSLISQIDEKEAFLESEDRAPTTLPSVPDSHNIHCSSGKSFGASDGNQVDGIKDNAKFSLSPSSHDNKSAYSSMCPTGRISFKLYDWNPAEFPRRLRHQIFQWLASMPVELEGYIRPGCIILTTFIAMPKSMWVKLLEDPVAHVHDFVVTPGRMLSGRGTMFVYLNNMMFRVIGGAASVTEVKVEVKSPRLHYVHPACFEAGKPMEFFACGSNLQQPKLRFLVSFAGKYLAYDYCVTFPSEEATCSVNHQLYKILIPFTEPDVFGPVFIEVENQSGLSNFIPLLIGSKETCSEMKKMQERLDVSLFPEVIGLSLKSCEFLTLRQKAYMELITDVSWVLKKPASENFHRITSASQIQRFTFLLKFLISNESTFVLEKVFEYLKILMVNVNLSCAENGCTVTDIKQFLKYVECAREVLHLNLQKTGGSMQHLGLSESKRDWDSQSSSNTKLVLAASVTRLHMEAKGNFGKMGGSTIIDKRETVPLTNTDVVMDMTVSQEWSRNSCSHVFSRKSLRPRTTLFSIAFVVICFAICSVLLHPQKVGQLAVSIRRCLFDIY